MRYGDIDMGAAENSRKEFHDGYGNFICAAFSNRSPEALTFTTYFRFIDPPPTPFGAGSRQRRARESRE
jgi:hypothetical protein